MAVGPLHLFRCSLLMHTGGCRRQQGQDEEQESAASTPYKLIILSQMGNLARPLCQKTIPVDAHDAPSL